MIIKILGLGCRNCNTLKENTEKALKELDIEAEVIKVENFEEMATYGVMSLPALIVDEEIVSSGKILKTKEIVKILKKN